MTRNMMEKYPNGLEDVEDLRFQISRLKYSMSVECSSISEDGNRQTPDTPDVEKREDDIESTELGIETKEEIEFIDEGLKFGSGVFGRLSWTISNDTGKTAEDDVDLENEGDRENMSAGSIVSPRPFFTSEYLDNASEIFPQWKMEKYQQKYMGLQINAFDIMSEMDRKLEEKEKHDQFVEFLTQETSDYNTQMTQLKQDMHTEREGRKEAEEEMDQWRVSCKTNELSAIMTQAKIQELETQNEKICRQMENIARACVTSGPLEKKIKKLEGENVLFRDKKKSLLEKLRSMGRVGVNRGLEEAQLRAQKSNYSFGVRNSSGTQTEQKYDINGDDKSYSNVWVETVTFANCAKVNSDSKMKCSAKLEPDIQPEAKSPLISLFRNLKKRVANKFSKENQKRRQKYSCWSGIRNLFRDKNRVKSFIAED